MPLRELTEEELRKEGLAKSGLKESARKGISETLARLMEQSASVNELLGLKDRAARAREYSGKFEEKAEAIPDPGGFGGWLGYIGAQAPIEILKLWGGSKGAAPLIKGGAKLLPKGAAAVANRVLPWAISGGANEALMEEATPGSVGTAAAVTGAIPALSGVNRLVRGAMMSGLGAKEVEYSGGTPGEAGVQAAVLGLTSAIPGRFNPEKSAHARRLAAKEAAGPQRMSADEIDSLYKATSKIAEQQFVKGEIAKTAYGGGPLRRGRIVHIDHAKGGAIVAFMEKDGTVSTRAVPIEQLQASKSQKPLKLPGGREPAELDVGQSVKLLPKVEAAIEEGAELPARIGSSKTANLRPNTPEETLQAMNVLAQENAQYAGMRGPLPKHQGGPGKGWDEIIQGAINKGHMDAGWARMRRAGDPINEEMAMGLQQLSRAAQERYTAAMRTYQKYPDNVIAQARASEELARLKMFAEVASGGATTASRTLNVFKWTGPVSEEAAQALRAIKKLGGRENVDLTLKMVESLDNVHQLSGALPHVLKPTRTQKAVEFFKMNLLWGPQTHLVNMNSNWLFQKLDAAENMLAAGLGKLRPWSRDKVYVREAIARANAGIHAWPKALAVARQAFKLEQEGIALNKLEMSRQASLGGRFGRFHRTPGRLLVAEDEFAKTFAYHKELAAQATRRVLSDKSIPKARRNAAIRTHIENPDGELRKLAEDAAHRLTFTKDLGPNLKGIQNALNNSPGLQFIVPFFRTPANIAGEAIKRGGLLGLFAKSVQADLRAGGAARDLAIARMLMGGAMGTSVYLMKEAGMITGGGAPGPGEKQANYPTWQPYSIRVGDRWISYNRLEPVGMVMGMAADLAEYLDRGDKGTTNQKVGEFLLVFSKNLASKTFLKGIADFMLALSDPVRGAEGWAEGMTRGMVPMSALLGQTARALDPVRREASNPLESAMSVVPGLRGMLPESQNVLGETARFGDALGPDWISPYYGTRISKDPVARELGKLPISLGKPARVLSDGTELTDDEYKQVWGDANKKARDRVERLISRTSWDRKDEKAKVKAIKRIYTRERRKARERVLRDRRLRGE